MTDERYTLEEFGLNFIVNDNGRNLTAKQTVVRLNAHYEDTQRLKKDVSKLRQENEQLKQQIDNMSRFEHTGEHIRLSINIETGELQRHIYATGQWFGDFDRVLCENWINEEDYQKFIDRVIEVYNTEFKGDVE